MFGVSNVKEATVRAPNLVGQIGGGEGESLPHLVAEIWIMVKKEVKI